MTTKNTKIHHNKPALVLHAITLQHIAGVEYLHFEPSETGVSIIEGPNETGKTTLLNAFSLILANDKHGTQKQDIKAIKPIGRDEAPTIEVELSVGEYRLSLLRSYSTKAKSRSELHITSPTVDHASGEDAIARFGELLNAHSDPSLREAMVVKQGDVLQIHQLFDNQGLQQAVGQAIGQNPTDTQDVASQSLGPEPSTGMLLDSYSQEMLARVEHERLKYFTAKGTDFNTHVKQQFEEETTAAQHLEQCRAEVDRIEHEQQSIALATTRKEEALARLDKAEEQLNDLVAQRAASASIEREIEEQQQTMSTVDTALQTLQQSAHRRETMETAFQELRQQLTELQAKRTAINLRIEELQTAEKEQTQQRELYESERQVAAELQNVERLQNNFQQQTALLHANNTKLATMQQLQQQLQELQDATTQPPLSDAQLQEARSMLESLRIAEATQQAQSATISIAGETDAEFAVDGITQRITSTPHTFTVSRPMHLTFGAFQVDVQPPQEHTTGEETIRKLRQQLDELFEDRAQTTDVELLQDSGYEQALAQAIAQADAYNDQRREAAEIRKRIELVAAGEHHDNLERNITKQQADIERLEGQIERAQHRVKAQHQAWVAAVTKATTQADDAQQKPAALLSSIRAVAVVAEDILTAGVDAEQWLSIVDSMIAALGSNAQELEEARRDQAVLQSEVELIASRHDAMQGQLQEFEELAPAEELAAKTIELQNQRAQLHEAMQELKASANGMASVALLDERIAAVQNGQQADHAAVAEADRTMEVLRDRLRNAGGSAEAVAEAEQHLERIQARNQSLRRRAEAVRLLHSVLQDEKQQLLRKYQLPFQNELQHLAAVVFGDNVTFTMGEGIELHERVRNGLNVDINALSGGAKEQLAILYRLAVASLAGEGNGVPLFIDDALGFSDQDRIMNMNVLLNRLGNKHQIIITTCDASRYRYVTDAQRVSMEELTSVKA